MPGSQRSYPSLLFKGPSEDVDAAICTLFEEGCIGTETVAGSESVCAFFLPDTDLGPLCERLAQDLPRLRIGPLAAVAEQDWLEQWRNGLSGFALGERFYLSPSWQTPPKTNRFVLRIDPGQAFGTGSHDTTRVCLEFIEECAAPGMRVIDVGTGTGILAMAAAALGCEPVLAIDIDPAAASCARENVSRNGLEGLVEVLTGSLSDARPDAADLVIANLRLSILLQHLERLTAWTVPRGALILSGLLVSEIEDLMKSLPSHMEPVRYYTAGEWATLLARSTR
jgi:ribosomal protein L11 methyltransferase